MWHYRANCFAARCITLAIGAIGTRAGNAKMNLFSRTVAIWVISAIAAVIVLVHL